jgi:hypothetical protein
MRKIRRILFISLVLAAGLPNKSGADENSPPAIAVQIKRSGMLGYATLTSDTVYWLNNDSVLFIGGRPGMHEKLPDGRQPIKRLLMEWNTVSGAVTVRADMGTDANALCYDRGYVRYGFTTGNVTTTRVGPLGKEVSTTSGAEGKRVNPLTCKVYDEEYVRSKYGEGFVPLREEHGYWGGREDSRKRGMTIFVDSAHGQERFVDISGSRPRWSEYAAGYVFNRVEDTSGTPNQTGRMSLLLPSGEIRRFDIPAGPWFGGSTGYAITKQGVFMWSHAIRNGSGGGYLVEGGKPQRFITGYIFSFAVSPNGCNLAMNIKSAHEADDLAEMVMANLCARGV